MSEEEKKKKLRGFAKIVSKEIEPLNNYDKFKERYKDTEVKVLLNLKDGKEAALIVIDKGTIYVESIKNNPKENIKKKNAGWDGFLEAKLQVFVDILTGGDVTVGMIVKKILFRQVKIRGIKKILILLELFSI
jgi:putative sterol carrier protein